MPFVGLLATTEQTLATGVGDSNSGNTCDHDHEKVQEKATLTVAKLAQDSQRTYDKST